MCKLISLYDKWYASGVIISKYWILTAGSSFEKYGHRLANHQFNISVNYYPPHETNYSIAAVIRHHQYSFNSYNNDLAMVKTTKGIVFSKLVRPIALAKHFEKDWNEDVQVNFAGYGDTSDRNQHYQLRQRGARTVNIHTCEPTFPIAYLYKSHLCITKSACLFDGGGAVTYNNTLIGILSFTRGCWAEGIPEVCSRVSFFYDWIMSTMIECDPK